MGSKLCISTEAAYLAYWHRRRAEARARGLPRQFWTLSGILRLISDEARHLRHELAQPLHNIALAGELLKAGKCTPQEAAQWIERAMGEIRARLPGQSVVIFPKEAKVGAP